MENKPKTSSYKRLKPYIKGFPIPFVLAIVVSSHVFNIT